MINCFDKEFAFLSNFYPAEITIDEITFPTVEHAFQALKTNNQAERMAISKAETPGKAKRMGRQVSLRADWENVKNDVMYKCVSQKFSKQPLKDMLIRTGSEYIEEGTTWHDNCWGNCSCKKCKDIPGENRLGKILMRVRKEISKENII